MRGSPFWCRSRSGSLSVVQSAVLGRRGSTKSAIDNDAVVPVPMFPTSYLEREAQLAQLVTTLLEEKTP